MSRTATDRLVFRRHMSATARLWTRPVTTWVHSVWSHGFLGARSGDAGGWGVMVRLRAVPSTVWTAVGALAVLASTGLGVVLGAGLHVWTGPAATFVGAAVHH